MHFLKCMKDVIENGILRFLLAMLIGIVVAAVSVSSSVSLYSA